MIPAYGTFGEFNRSDLYNNEKKVSELLKVRRNVSPEEFNKYIAGSVLATRQPNTPWFARCTGNRFKNPFFNNNGLIGSLASKDDRLQLAELRLPQAVIERLKRLGYNEVQTAAGWLSQLPIGKRINWERKEASWLEPTVYRGLVPVSETCNKASVTFQAEGNRDETWVYLSYSLNGDNIGEAVVTFNYNGDHIIECGPIAEQNRHGQFPDEYPKELASIEPCQDTCDQTSVAKATFVTIGIQLHKESSQHPQHRFHVEKTHEREMRNNGYPVTYPTDLKKGLMGYDGRFTVATEGNYMAVTTAVGVDFTHEKDETLSSYFDSLCKRLDGLTKKLLK